jgi:hypothetical protein
MVIFGFPHTPLRYWWAAIPVMKVLLLFLALPMLGADIPRTWEKSAEYLPPT